MSWLTAVGIVFVMFLVLCAMAAIASSDDAFDGDDWLEPGSPMWCAIISGACS